MSKVSVHTYFVILFIALPGFREWLLLIAKILVLMDGMLLFSFPFWFLVFSFVHRHTMNVKDGYESISIEIEKKNEIKGSEVTVINLKYYFFVHIHKKINKKKWFSWSVLRHQVMVHINGNVYGSLKCKCDQRDIQTHHGAESATLCMNFRVYFSLVHSYLSYSHIHKHSNWMYAWKKFNLWNCWLQSISTYCE